MAQIMAMPQLAEADATISAVVKALSSARGYSREAVAQSIGSTRRTFMRRFSHGGWTAVEVARLAAFFGVEVGDLYAGRVDVSPPTGPRSPDGLPQHDSNVQPAGCTVIRPRHLIAVAA